ncbi:DUF6975 family protein [Sphingomonas edaphi]|uniref:Uncharacterized protein n=1 Tax=Sphingomonas edaphi TaxID=2315689 RepID=A0A418Q0G8_9SPHN|nr:hypothetical protein [Sphingomonas edaphi]RIX31496.1 hypothetical protein D3M59_00220 [Sphingomonas edaphi]
MAINQAVDRSAITAAEAQLARVANQGSAEHAYRLTLLSANGPNSARDLADAVHLFCSVYGRHPGLIELALHNCPAGPVRDWLREASDAYERERLYLVRLTAAVGPLPSTPGASETEAALVAQRHAIETLAKSERRGCALGAATALMSDWPSIRALLDRAADRMGMQRPAMVLPDEDSIIRVVSDGTDGMASERALAFGGEQLLLQNRGLFDLLEARAAARID